MRILFAIGIAVSALLLTSCTNPDTSGGVTMQKDVGDGHPKNADFPHGACGDQHSFAETNTGCGWIGNQDVSPETKYYISPNANLSGQNLLGLNLSNANLTSANLVNTNLSYADLSNANLTGATLTGANLDRVNLTKANLTSVYINNPNNEPYKKLTNANLTNANLTNATMLGMDWSGANLTGADFSGSDIADVFISPYSPLICPNGSNYVVGGNDDCWPF